MARLSVVLVLFLFLLNPAVTSGDDGSEAEDSENDWLEEIEIEKHTLELIPGSRIENTWLALDNNWIAVVNTRSVSGLRTWWECRYRRVANCPFRLETEISEQNENPFNDKHEIVKMMNPNCHTCHQEEANIYVAKFRGQVRRTLMGDYGAGFMPTYEKIKTAMCKNILDSNLRERVQNQLPKAASLKSAGTRAKLKGIPKAPKTLKNVDWSQLPVPIEHHLLASDPALCLYVFGTEKLAREFFESTFKSCDGTFKIAPIGSHQGKVSDILIFSYFLINLTLEHIFRSW